MLKRSISVLMVVCIIMSMMINGFAHKLEGQRRNSSNTISTNESKPWKQGQLVVKYKQNTSFRASSKIKQNEKVIKSNSNGLTLIEVEEDELTEKIEKLKKDRDVEYVAPNYMRRITGFPSEDPNDPEFINQWGLRNINAQGGWINIGDPSDLNEVIVAVIDTGIDMHHEDLKDIVVEGYDFVDMDNDPSYGPFDEEHASHVAGIIAASTDNGVGIAGTSGKAPVKIMPLRVLEAGWGDDYTISESIYYAVDNGAQVINMSLGGPMESPVLTEAVEYALSNNVVVVASAGNMGMDAVNYYPAAIPGVIAVSATDVSNDLASFSNYGGVVKLAAPGVDILSTIPENMYEYYDGTSMSAPFVSAACAILLTKNPSLTNIEVEHILTDSSKDIGDKGRDEKFGFGLLDIESALNITEIKPRLDIINLINGTTVYDVVNIQTRFTYPENISKKELYVNDELVETMSELTGMFSSFELDTYKYMDGVHKVKVVAYDSEKIYQQEIKINVRNTVYTGLRVKLTHNGMPISGGNIRVWNKYTQDGNTYYDYVHSAVTSKNGIAIVPGSSAPNGNGYVIVANYGFANGEEYSNATLVEEAIAPNIIEIDGKDLVPVTVNTGLDTEGQIVFASLKFPGSKDNFEFNLLPDISGQFKAYLNKGIYSFEVFTYGNESSETGYYLNKQNVSIDSKNAVVNIESDRSKLAKINTKYKNIYGFIPSNVFMLIRSKSSMLSKGIMLDNISKAADIYVTPGDYIIDCDIIGSKGKDNANIFLEGSEVSLKAGRERLLEFGGVFTGRIKTAKTKYIPGENVGIDASITDSQSNKLVYMDFIQDDPFFMLKNQMAVFYKRGNTKVGLSIANNQFEVSQSPVEYEYKSPIVIQLIDSRNNVVTSQQKEYIDGIHFQIEQDIIGGNYRLRMIAELPYLIQAQTNVNVVREAKNNAVKFTIELPEKEKAVMADIQAVNIKTGEFFYQWGYNLLNGEMFMPLPNGNYKVTIISNTSSEKQVVHLVDVKSPGDYNLTTDNLQSVKFLVKDEEGEVINRPTSFTFSIPDSKERLSFGLSNYFVEEESEFYITKGNYNICAQVYSEQFGIPERAIIKEEVLIDTPKNLENTQQTIDFTSDNLTEVSLDSKSEAKEAIVLMSDPKTGVQTFTMLTKGSSFKISKGFYNLDIICEKIEYGSAYAYILSSQKDFSKDSTQIGIGTKFSISVIPDKTAYRRNEIMKSEHSIMDRFGNKVTRVFSFGFFSFMSSAIKESSGDRIIKQNNGDFYILNMKEKEYKIVPYDIRAPFVYIINSLGEVVASSKSPEYYTNSQVKIDSSWAKRGNYKIRLTVDIDADGDLSSESYFQVR